MNAKFRKFDKASRYEICNQTTVPCALGNERFFVTTPFFDASGGAMPRAPEFTASLGARYGFDVEGGRVNLSGNFYHTSSLFFDSAQQFRQKSYSLLGLRAEWTDASDRFTFAIFGDNVTNTKYLTQVAAHTPGIGAVWGAPATVGGSVRMKF